MSKQVAAGLVGVFALFLLPSAIFADADAATQLAKGLTASDLFILLRPNQTDGPLALIDRELFRQAMLMAARDGMGLWTRDEVMRETTPDARGDLSKCQGKLTVRGNSLTHWVLVFTASGFTSPQLKVQQPYGDQWTTDVARASQSAEALSRGDFLDWLKSDGFRGSAPPDSDVAMPASVEGRLGEMTILSQYIAVQQLHQAIREHGASPALLGGLVRGYANLGELTRHQWPATTYVFAARALLYAQRLVVKNHKSPFALWNRAYAEAMTGLHAAAMKDLAAAGKDLTAAPHWAPLILPLCKFDRKKLLEVANSNNQDSELAAFLAFLVASHSGSQSLVLETGELALQLSPGCEYVSDSMCEVAGGGYLDELTQNAFDSEVQALSAGLPRITDLPDNVRQAWDKAHTKADIMAHIADLSQAFVDAPDTSEPSWSVLGRLLQEGNFKRVYRRVYCLLFDWGVDASDLIQQSAPLVKGHPLGALIDAMVAHYEGQAMPDSVKHLNFVDATFRMDGTMRFDSIVFADRTGYGNFSMYQGWHCGSTAWEYAEGWLPWNEQQWINSDDPTFGREMTHKLAVISPFSPVTAAFLVRWDDPQVDSHLAQWTKDLAGDPAFDMAVARRFIQLNQDDKAIPYLQDFLKVGTDCSAYILLAQCYLKQNDEAKWFSTLQDSLQQVDYALDHAQVNCAIANHYMEQGKYAQAQPYAGEAAQSQTIWTMECAVRCCLGLRDYNQAIQLARNIADRYDYPMTMYTLCRTTAKGDMASARAAMENWISRSVDIRAIAEFYAGEKNEPGEINMLKQGAAQGDPVMCLWLAMIYDHQGNTTARDAAVHTAVVKGPDSQSPNGQSDVLEVKLARLFEKTLSGSGKLDMTAVQAICDQAAPDDRTPVEYFAGKFLQNHSDVPAGLEMLKRCAKSADMASVTGAMARMELFDNGIDPYSSN
jgi:tetratricopeptide (TPR) repeat protein